MLKLNTGYGLVLLRNHGEQTVNQLFIIKNNSSFDLKIMQDAIKSTLTMADSLYRKGVPLLAAVESTKNKHK